MPNNRIRLHLFEERKEERGQWAVDTYFSQSDPITLPPSSSRARRAWYCNGSRANAILWVVFTFLEICISRSL